jgi:hypothetical protein
MKLYESIQSAMDSLTNELAPAVQSIVDGTREFNPDEAFDALIHIADLKRQARDIESTINELFTADMRARGEKVREFTGHTVERKFSSTRKNWQHETLLQTVVNTSLADEQSQVVDPTTGEVLDLTVIAKPLIDNVVRNLTAAAAIREWRVTALRAIVPGLNPDDFCEVEKTEKVSIRTK